MLFPKTDSGAPKYSLLEIERRWLAALHDVGSLEGRPYREIEDRYIDGTRLRLRQVNGPEGVTYKLCKKYEPRAPLGDAITNIYLTQQEHRQLCVLPARVARKRRYALAAGALDVYAEGTAIFEVEFASSAEALAYVPPSFVGREVTGDPAYSGAALATPDR